MFCWGNMKNGELGLGGLEEEIITQPRPLPFASTENIAQVGCGDNHTILILEDGTVYSFGSNDYGQLGHSRSRTRPEKVDGLDAHTIRHVACGSHHTLVLNEWGQVFAWGSNSFGQLGLNVSDQIIHTPKMIKVLATKQVVQIACGQNHSLALTNVGELFAWGANTHGQLGVGKPGFSEIKPIETRSLFGVPISFIACGGNHSFAVSRSGGVYGWGRNSFGQLGIGDTEDRPYPVQLKSIRYLRVCFVACGMDHTAALTRDGGVFTFGAGMYGQLGHGMAVNEMLPRQILELMGSTVTQIACGRCHTMALVPSRSRVFSFGLGGSGQLGAKCTRNVNSPQLVSGEAWMSLNGLKPDVIQPADLPPSPIRIVWKIFCGGDQSFALTRVQSDGRETADYRERSPDTQILTISPKEIKKLLTVSDSETVDLDLMRYVETALSHAACFNASFLRADGSHYGCCSKNHGLDLDLARDTFDQLSRVGHPGICELVHRCICSELLPSLSPLPPDMEALRVHMLLPLFHECLQAKYFEVLQVPFAATVLSLKPEAGKALEYWWAATKSDYFLRLINIFKQVVVHIISLSDARDQSAANRLGAALRICLEVLKRVNATNRESAIPKVGHEVFYIPELTERVNLPDDYYKWVTDGSNSKEFRLCSYSFVFDAKAKTQVLQTDQRMQMKVAVHDAVTRVHQWNPFLLQAVPAEIQYLVLQVRRDNLAYDTLGALLQTNRTELKKPLKVKFFGEEAEDAGGVRKEFFMLLLKEILDPKYGMFTDYQETHSIWFSEMEFGEQQMYHLIGLLCGLAIYNFTIINLPFPLVLYKKLLGEPVQLDDLAGLSPTLLRSLHNLLEYEGDDVEEVFGLNFAISREVLGQVRTDDLKPGGSEILVSQKNKQEYVDLYVDFILNKSVAKHFQAFSQGFHDVCGGPVLRLFQAHELMDLVVGNENYDWYELQRNAEYKNGFSHDHPTIKLFWEVFHELNHEQKKRFLLFLTGTDRIPILGMNAVKIIIQRTTGGDSYLPVAHTCFNLLDLPQYNTKEKLRYKLLQAIQQTQGFALA